MTALALIGGVLLLLVAGIVRSLLADEAKGLIRDLSQLLIRRAVDQLPSMYQEEKKREWTAEFCEQAAKPLSSLMWSWRLFRSRRSTAHELRGFEESPSALIDSEPIATQTPVAEEMPPYLRALVDGLHAYDWQRIASALRDATLGQVDDRIETATARFCALIDDARAISETPRPRFASTDTWADVYDPEPPQLRPGFRVSVRQRQEVVPPKESWPVRLLHNLLSLGPKQLLWLLAPIAMLAIGVSVSSTVVLLSVSLVFAIAPTWQRVLMLVTSCALVAYDGYLWSLAMDHGLLGWGEASTISWVLYWLWAATLVFPTALIVQLRLRRRASIPAQMLFVFDDTSHRSS